MFNSDIVALHTLPLRMPASANNYKQSC